MQDSHSQDTPPDAPAASPDAATKTMPPKSEQGRSFFALLVNFTLISSMIFFAITALVLIPLSDKVFHAISDHSSAARFGDVESRTEYFVYHALDHIRAYDKAHHVLKRDPDGEAVTITVTMTKDDIRFATDAMLSASIKPHIEAHAALYRTSSPPHIVTLATIEAKDYMLVSMPDLGSSPEINRFYIRILLEPHRQILGHKPVFDEEWMGMQSAHGSLSYGHKPPQDVTIYTRVFSEFGLTVQYSSGNDDWLLAQQNQTTRMFAAWLFVAALLSFVTMLLLGSGGLVRTYRELEQARKMMRHREQRLRNIIENAADGMITISQEGYVTSFNPASERIFGYKAGEILGRNINTLMDDEHADRHNKAMQRYLDKDKKELIGKTLQLEGRHKDGHNIPIELSISEYNFDGVVTFSAIIRDITERKQAQEDIERSRNFLRLVMDNVPDMVFVKDEEFRIVEANPEFLKIYPPKDRASILGTTTIEKFPKEQADLFVAEDRKALNSGYSEIFEDITFYDGTKKTLYSKKIGFIDQQGKRYLIGLSRDVTREKQEQQLLESLYVISHSRHLILKDKITHTLAQTAHYLDMPSAFFAVVKGERMVVQDRAGEQTPLPTDIGAAEDFFAMRDAYLATGRAVSSFTDNFGTAFCGLTGAKTFIKSPIFANEEMHGMICFYSPRTRTAFTEREESFVSLVTQWIGLEISEDQNIEKLKDYNRRLIDSNQELDDFAYIASHDLKEPLRGMSNFAQFLKEDYGDKFDGEGLFMVETLGKLSKRLEILIDSLWQYSRLGRTELARQNTDIGALIRDTVDVMQIEITQAKGVITIQQDPPLPTIYCDPVRVAEIFRNLIVNALKYNDNDTKTIEIGGYMSHDTHDTRHGHDNIPSSAAPVPPEAAFAQEGENIGEFVFFVRDNGIGIHPDHHDLVFKIFKRLHQRDAYGGGTGSGLTIIQKIIKKHHGKIWLDSDGKTGTTVFFTLSGQEEALQRRAEEPTTP